MDVGVYMLACDMLNNVCGCSYSGECGNALKFVYGDVDNRE